MIKIAPSILAADPLNLEKDVKKVEKAGCDCYELFNVGHTLIKCPRSPGLGQTIAALFKGKKPAELQREKYEAVERQLNEFGWKTVAENP